MRSLAILASLLGGLSVVTGASGETETEMPEWIKDAAEWNITLNKIGQRVGLSQASLEEAKAFALGYILLGPCRGSASKLPPGADGALLAFTPNPDSAFSGVVFEMIGTLIRLDGLGRSPSDHMCKFAEVTTFIMLYPQPE